MWRVKRFGDIIEGLYTKNITRGWPERGMNANTSNVS